jgi:DNA-3-methyladenine glycosylase
MARRRRIEPARRELTNGPGKLCQALAITREHDGLPLDAPPFALRPRTTEPELAVGPRIGISRGQELPWRFGLAGSRFLSRPLRPA